MLQKYDTYLEKCVGFGILVLKIHGVLNNRVFGILLPRCFANCYE
jgi:hypothetical protein